MITANIDARVALITQAKQNKSVISCPIDERTIQNASYGVNKIMLITQVVWFSMFFNHNYFLFGFFTVFPR